MSAWFACQPAEQIEHQVEFAIEYDVNDGSILGGTIGGENVSANVIWALIGREQPQLDLVRDWADKACDEQMTGRLRGAA
jgi:hypothetical protein